jgi:hypothetical protein
MVNSRGVWVANFNSGTISYAAISEPRPAFRRPRLKRPSPRFAWRCISDGGV